MKTIPYCPNPKCINHTLKKKAPGWYGPRGSYKTIIVGKKPRYMCKACGKTFVERTFSIDYYTKRKLDYSRIYTHIKTSSGIRDMARDLNCTPDSISNRILRLSRQIWTAEALYLHPTKTHENLLKHPFLSCIESRDSPIELNLTSGRNSQFIYDYSSSLLPKIARNNITKNTIKAIKPIRRTHKSKNITVNTKPSEKDMNIMIHKKGDLPFSCRYLNRQIRKDLADHIHNTVQFPHDTNNCMERFAIYKFWHNYEKPWRINKIDRTYANHSDAAGIHRIKIHKMIYWKEYGYRIPFSLVDCNLSASVVNHWHRLNINPRGKSSMRIPHFIY